VEIVYIKKDIGLNVLGNKAIASEDDIADLMGKNIWFLVTVRQIKNADLRKKPYLKLKKGGARMAKIISPLSKVSRYGKIGEGP
jgi:hypothetical protein